MDLRSIINTDGADNSAQKHASTPVTPSQAGPPLQVFRDFPPPPPQASPYRHLSQDLGPIPYTSPTTFQGAYHTRTAPPLQLQPPSQSDLRSPAASSHSAHSPYRQAPTSFFSGHQYPFPQNQPPPSPNHQISLQQQQQQRESYSHNANSSSPHLQNHNLYNQVSSGVPQTPLVGTPGGSFPHPPQQQRSQSSSHSTPTPTSAQSQHQFYSQPIHGSPISTGHPQSSVHHQSQPGTPLGPPISIPRQSSSAYPQPQSPYSQRTVSIGGFPPQYPNIHTSPAPPPPPQITRMPSTPNTFESHRSSGSDITRQSQSERERSLSVSPKTRLPTKTVARISLTPDQSAEMERSRGIKREREDSDSSQLTTANGRQSMESNTMTAATPSPVQPARKRPRYMEPPIWAQKYKRGRGKEASPIINKRSSPQANGKVFQRPSVNTNLTPQQQSPPQQSQQVVPVQVSGKIKSCLGPWEPSILGVQPMEECSKIIADWLFVQVVNRSDVNELANHGIQIEIEAKLGQLINRDTLSRLALPTQTECVLTSDGQGVAGTRTLDWNFSSSMTEGQHKAMNNFLNEKAQESYTTDPPRVNIQYKHRRERDVFYELPRQIRKSLPPIMQLNSNPHHAMKVRVTHDEKTGEMLAKIIKARVSDLDIYLPRQPVDCRISINLEMTYQGDIRELEEISKAQRSPDRSKDRLSYTHSHYQFDLTQVTMSDGIQKPTKEHELEIELSTAALIEQGRCAMANPPREHMYPELVQGLLDNIRVLARNVPAP